MEFRLFFPVLVPSDSEWLTVEEIYSYNKSLLKLSVNDSIGTEDRTDTYLIGQSYFGLKCRNGKKIELKVRLKPTENSVNQTSDDSVFTNLTKNFFQSIGGTESSSSMASFQHHPTHFIEEYKKFKLGKKDISLYKTELLQILSNFGYESDFDSNAKLIDERILVDIMKSRKNNYIGDICYEYCDLDISVENHVRRKWISVAVEGTHSDIGGFLRQQHQTNHLWECMHILLSIIMNSHKREAAIQAFCLPIVSGYPQWIRFIGGKSDANEIESEILTNDQLFLNFCSATG